MIAFMIDRAQERLAFKYETVGVQVDLKTLPAKAFPPDVTLGLDRLPEEDRRLDWRPR